MFWPTGRREAEIVLRVLVANAGDKVLQPIAAVGEAAGGDIGAQLVAAAMGMQASEMPPTAAELQACSRQQAAYAALMTKWAALKAKAR